VAATAARNVGVRRRSPVHRLDRQHLRDVLRLQPTATVGPDDVLLIPNPLFREGVAANQPVPMQVAIPVGGIIWRA